MTHTFGCLREQATRELERRAYRMLWPCRCSTCYGVGGKWDAYDPSPAGIALSPGSILDWDPCLDCLDLGVCPRCAHKYDVESDGFYALIEDNECVHCKWKWDRDETHEPPPYECGCWYELEFADDFEIFGKKG